MAINLQIFVFILLATVILMQPAQMDKNEAWSCTFVSSGDLYLNLTCPNHTDWFHVVREEFSDNGNCTTWPTSYNSLYRGSDGLDVNCVGRQPNDARICKEASDKSQTSVRVVYECIEDDFNYNMCDNLSAEKTGELYLASPDFFNNSSNTNGTHLCKCRILASSLKGKVLFAANASLLNMSCNGCSVLSGPGNEYWVNEEAILGNSTDSNILDISLELNGRATNSTTWIEIRDHDGGSISLACNDEIWKLTTEPTRTDTPSTAGINQNIYLYILGAVAGVLLLAVLIVVAFVVVCDLRRQRAAKSGKANTLSDKETAARSNWSQETEGQDEAKHIYYELEPDPNVLQEPGLIPAPLQKTKGTSTSGNGASAGRPASDDTSSLRESGFHRYSDVEDNAESAAGEGIGHNASGRRERESRSRD